MFGRKRKNKTMSVAEVPNTESTLVNQTTGPVGDLLNDSEQTSTFMQQPEQPTTQMAVQNVNYNNTMPGATGSTQPEVTLPDDSSVVTERRDKVKRPTKDY